jgi:hypothetical protein
MNPTPRSFPRVVSKRHASFILLIASFVLIAGAYAASAREGLSVRPFVGADGRLDCAALVASGYEGPVDISAYQLAFTPNGSVSALERSRESRTSRRAMSASSPTPASPVVNVSTFTPARLAAMNLAPAPRLPAQDENWWSGFGPPSQGGQGMNNGVDVLASPTGPLVAGGHFTLAGPTPVSLIASWDGAAWSSIGGGMMGSGDPSVHSLATYGGALVAGGDYLQAGGVSANNIASWNGVAWSPLGTGTDGIVVALAVYNGSLIAGGNFVRAGAINANHIARWDGSTWTGLAGGVNKAVTSLAIYNGALIVGGYFTQAGGVAMNRIASWNGVAWSPLGMGMDLPVTSLALYNGELIAGGAFTRAGRVNANRIARWNGAMWNTLGSGVNRPVIALTVYNGDLVVGGRFTTAGGIPASLIARWNGSTWSAFGSGLTGGVEISEVRTLTVWNASLYAGGDFTTAGGKPSLFIARWDDAPTDARVASRTPGVSSSEGAYAMSGTWTPLGSDALSAALESARSSTAPAGGERLQLSGSPAPFQNGMTIHYALPRTDHVRLTLYDATGRRVATLIDAVQSSGEHEIALSRRSSQGAVLTPGVYLLRLEAADTRQSLRIVCMP